MSERVDVDNVAAALQVSIGLLRRRLQLTPTPGDLTMPETSALARLDRGGPASSAELARVERISPQSMGATLAGLEKRELIARDTDPADGRRVVLTVTDAGREVLRDKRNARAEQIASALTSSGFTAAELRTLMAAGPLIERLAHAISTP